MTTLIVADSATRRRMVAGVLREAGCAAIEESAGVPAADAIAPEVGLLIVEWSEESDDGLTLAQAARAATRETPLRVVLLSARGSRADLDRAIEAKVDGYVLLPVTRDTLRERLQPLIEPTEGVAEAA